jgi:hypothetical protein
LTADNESDTDAGGATKMPLGIVVVLPIAVIGLAAPTGGGGNVVMPLLPMQFPVVRGSVAD